MIFSSIRLCHISLYGHIYYFTINFEERMQPQPKVQRMELQQFDFSDIIYESQPINKIQELDIHSLRNHSQQFVLNFERRQSLKEGQFEKSQEERFNAYIVKIIEMIQPSKLLFAEITQLINLFLQEYYPEDSKIEMRKAAKEKNILVMNRLSVNQEKQLFTQILDNIQHLKKCLLLRQTQLGMVLYIEDNSKIQTKEQFLSGYQSNFSELGDYVIPKEKVLTPINYFLIDDILEQEVTFYQDYTKRCKSLKEEIIKCKQRLALDKMVKTESKNQIETHIKKLKIIGAKIETIADLFPYACVKSYNDLFSLDKTHARWKYLFAEDVILYKIYGQGRKVNQSFENLKANLNIINAAMNIMNQNNENHGFKNIGSLFNSVGKVMQIALSKTAAHHQAEVMIASPNQKLAKDIWNLPQRKQFKTFIELTLPSIQYSVQFFIPRLVQRYFDDKLNNRESELPNFDISQNHAKYFKELIDHEHEESRVSIRINNVFTLKLKEFVQQNQKKKGYIESKISQYKKLLMSTVDIFKTKYVKDDHHKAPKAVIFHIHGGGFISMSSFIHQTYTRTWATDLQVPIVSVDYGKAPEHPFPEGLEDCLQAYLWTLHVMKQLYEFQPEKIILVGDSAGGNLVASLLNLLINCKIRLPDGIVMVYPALNLNYFDYSPSLFTSLNDMILPHTFLRICLNSYLKDPRYKPTQNYYVSPILTPDDILEKYPKTKIFVGSKDPFHDDCCRFAQKLQKLKPGNVQLKIFQQFPHGFLQFDMKNQPHYYCRQAVKEVQEALSELLGLKQQQ